MTLSTRNQSKKSFMQFIHIDMPLLFCIFALLIYGLVILYSASNQNSGMFEERLLHIGLALGVMFVFAQIPPSTYRRWALFLYALGLVLIIVVLIAGHIGKGAPRWLSLGFFRFQPSEIMKLALPMFLAYHFHKIHLPLSSKTILFALLVILVPTILVAKEPDLGTGILIAVAGFSVLFLAGLSFRLMGIFACLTGLCAPVVWFFMHNYQRQRVLIFLNPNRDPLGNGYHIIQSKIAIGSGGFFGKGWLNGTQSHLQFLPEHATDFIFAVCGEEFGLIGCVFLIILFCLVIARGLYITVNAQDTFTRLLAGSLTLTFFISFFTNMGMVSGMLPVVGLPLPLISYGGTSMVTLMASFGILMSIQTHRKLLST